MLQLTGSCFSIVEGSALLTHKNGVVAVLSWDLGRRALGEETTMLFLTIVTNVYSVNSIQLPTTSYIISAN